MGMTEEDEEFNRIEREANMKKRKYDDDDIQDYIRPWVGLTDAEIISMSRYDLEYAALIGEVERKLKEKNT